MKAVERFDAVQDQHAAASSEFEQAKEEAKEATQVFNEVKQKRHETFMNCFEHISSELSAIYKDLTKVRRRSEVKGVGGRDVRGQTRPWRVRPARWPLFS